MRALVLGSLALVACGGSSSSSSRPPSNRSVDDPGSSMIDAETVVGSSTKTEPQLAREQAIEQARAAGILGSATGSAAPSPATPSDPLDKEAIRREVRARLKPITLCYEQRLLEDATLQGTTKMTFVIGPDGRVISSTGSGFDGAVDACVAEVIKGIAFPAPAGGSTMQVSYPFAFRPAS